jgi:hypothetical protein
LLQNTSVNNSGFIIILVLFLFFSAGKVTSSEDVLKKFWYLNINICCSTFRIILVWRGLSHSNYTIKWFDIAGFYFFWSSFFQWIHFLRIKMCLFYMVCAIFIFGVDQYSENKKCVTKLGFCLIFAEVLMWIV